MEPIATLGVGHRYSTTIGKGGFQAFVLGFGFILVFILFRRLRFLNHKIGLEILKEVQKIRDTANTLKNHTSKP